MRQPCQPCQPALSLSLAEQMSCQTCVCVCVCDRKPNKGNMCNLYGAEGAGVKRREAGNLLERVSPANPMRCSCLMRLPACPLIYFTRGHNKLGPRLRALPCVCVCDPSLSSAFLFFCIFFISAVGCVCAASFPLSLSLCVIFTYD